MQAEKVIKFYRKGQQYGFMSNFYESPFETNGKKYATNQHYFQSKKFQGLPYQQKVALAKNPKDAFDLGRIRSKQHPLRKDWEEVKETIMLEGLRLKFTQNIDLKDKLLATKGYQLIQHTEKDSYWGDGGNGEGKNRLGFLLMQVRNQISKD